MRYTRAMHIKHLSTSDKKWLACLYDTEGAIFISKIKEHRVKRGYLLVPAMTVSNTCKALMEEAKRILGVGYLNLIKDERKGLTGRELKDRYSFMLAANHIRELLPQILPYLIVKKEQAPLMLEFLACFECKSVEGDEKTPDSFQYLRHSKECKRLFLKGWAKSELARKYGVHPSSITNWLRAMGITTSCQYRGEYPEKVLKLYGKMKILNAKGKQEKADG